MEVNYILHDVWESDMDNVGVIIVKPLLGIHLR